MRNLFSRMAAGAKSAISSSIGGAQAARRHQAGIVNRMTEDWFTTMASIDADIRGSLTRLRNRSRDLCQNNDYAKAARREVVNNIVGVGIKMQSQVMQKRGGKMDHATNRAIEKAWKKWCRKENCDVTGMLSFDDIERMIASGIFESGEILVRKVKQPMGNMKIPYALELIEADQLDETLNVAQTQNGNQIKLGVEKNAWGRPVAFHFWPRHPGDYQIGWMEDRGTTRRRIPAEEIEHLFIPERVNQSRGVPWLASTAIRLHHMGGYEQAEVVSARATASLMGFIESTEGELQGDMVPDGSGGMAEAADEKRVTNFEPGIFKYLNSGERVVVPDLKRPSGQFDPFMRVMVNAMSAGLGVAAEKISGDYSRTNYSSTRQSLVNERDNWRVLQVWLMRHFHQPIFEEWFLLAVLSGELAVKGFEANPDSFLFPKWMPRGWSWVDPQKEVAAYSAAVRNGFMTQAQVIAQGGGDYDELVTHRAREVELNEENGLVFDSNPAQVNNKGILQPGAVDPSETDPGGNPEDEDQDPEEDPET